MSNMLYLLITSECTIIICKYFLIKQLVFLLLLLIKYSFFKYSCFIYFDIDIKRDGQASQKIGLTGIFMNSKKRRDWIVNVNYPIYKKIQINYVRCLINKIEMRETVEKSASDRAEGFCLALPINTR